MVANSVRLDRDTVTKSYTKFATLTTFVRSLEGRMMYSGRAERYKREVDALKFYNSHNLPVPEYLSTDPEKMETTMRRIRGRTLLKMVKGGHLTQAGTLDHISRCAEALKQIHEYGEHGDSTLDNFIFDENGNVTVIDFERISKNGKDGDLSVLLFGGLVGTDLPENEIVRAIKYGYGKEPESPPYRWKLTSCGFNPATRIAYGLKAVIG